MYSRQVETYDGDTDFLRQIAADRSLIDRLLDFIRGIKNSITIKLTGSERAMLDEAERNLVNLMRGESQEQKNKKFSLISGWRRTEIERVGSNLIIDNNHQLESEIKKIYSGESNKILYYMFNKQFTIFML